MKIRSCVLIILALLVGSLIMAACTPSSSAEPCVFTANEALTVYRLPDSASDVFGVISTGETFDVLARTAEGWVGFDPGVAQAGNIGLAHHRWVLLNATISPSCLSSVALVTLADVQADLAASGQ
jgi:hypothetical protein